MKKNLTDTAVRVNVIYTAILAAFAFLLYANAIPNNYNIDDNIVVLNANVQKGVAGIPAILTSRYQEAGQYSYGYRPVAKITYAIESSFFGKNPHISHLINTLLYSLIVVFLFLVLNTVFAGYLPFFTFCTVLLYAAHPLHTEAVASLKNREELLCFLGCIVSLFYFMQFRQSGKFPALVAGILWLALAMLVKQTAASFIFIVPLTIYFFFKTNKIPAAPPATQANSAAEKFFPGTEQINSSLSWNRVNYFLVSGLILMVLGLSLHIKYLSGFSLAFLFLSCFKKNTSLKETGNTLKNRWAVAGMICLLFSYPVKYYSGIKYLYVFSAVFFLIYQYKVSVDFKNQLRFLFNKLSGTVIYSGQLFSAFSRHAAVMKYPLMLLIIVFIPVFLIIYVPDLFLPDQQRALHSFENPLFSNNTFLPRIALGFYSLLVYLKLLVFPHPLLFYYGYKHIPDVGLSNFFVILSMVIHAGLLFLAIFYFKKHPMLSYGILFYICGISLFSNIPAPVPGIVAERLLFMPSLGFCIVITWVIFRLFKADPASAKIPPPAKRKILTVLILILIPYSIKTIARNRDWKDEMTLFSHDIRYLKNSINANFLYASQLIFHINPNPATPAEKEESEKKVTLAMKHFSRVLELDSANVKALANIGTLYFQFYANYPLAVAYLQKAISYDSLFANAYLNLGLCYEKMGKNDEAVINFNKSIRCDSMSIQPFSALVNHYFRAGDETTAFRINQRFQAAHPESDIPYLSEGQYQYEKGNETGAVSLFEKAVEKNPANRDLCRWLAEYFMNNGNREKAQYYSALASK